MGKLIKCKSCQTEVSKGAKACPSCGKDNRSFFRKHKILTAIGVLFVLGAIGRLGDGTSSSATKTTTASTTEQKTEQPAKVEETAKVEQPVKTEEKTEAKVEPKKEEVKVSADFKNALRQAENYSKMMHMSKAGIYDQLTSEYGGKFQADAAQYAIDNLKADYKKNALEQAKTYQGAMSMSKSAVYDQLTSEYGGKFTAEEAQYAVDNLKE